MRLTMIVRADFVDRANQAIQLEDTEGGERCFTAPLATTADPSTITAYWCSWDLGATRHDPRRVAQFLTNKGVPVGDLRADGYWIDPQRRFAVVNGDRHEPQTVLDHLGLTQYADPEAVT